MGKTKELSNNHGQDQRAVKQIVDLAAQGWNGLQDHQLEAW